MRVYDEGHVIEIEVRFSGKTMPGDGPAPCWRGSGSLSGIDRHRTHGHGDLPTPAEMRGKAPADMPIVSSLDSVHRHERVAVKRF